MALGTSPQASAVAAQARAASHGVSAGPGLGSSAALRPPGPPIPAPHPVTSCHVGSAPRALTTLLRDPPRSAPEDTGSTNVPFPCVSSKFSRKFYEHSSSLSSQGQSLSRDPPPQCCLSAARESTRRVTKRGGRGREDPSLGGRVGGRARELPSPRGGAGAARRPGLGLPSSASARGSRPLVTRPSPHDLGAPAVTALLLQGGSPGTGNRGPQVLGESQDLTGEATGAGPVTPEEGPV